MTTRLARAIVTLWSRLAPAHFRDRFREEWFAELTAEPSSRRRLVRAAGAVFDALSAHWTVPPSRRSHAAMRPSRSDVLLAFRQIQQTPLLSAAAILALSVGIGAATVAFAGVLNIFYGELPVPDPDRIVKIEDFDRVGGWRVSIDRDEFERRRTALTSFVDVAGYTERNALVAAPGRAPEIRRAGYSTANLARTLGVAPRIGRDLVAGDRDVVLISDLLHERAFERHPSAIGQAIRIDDRAYEVIGVMPAGWQFPMSADLWAPLDDSDMNTAGAAASLSVVGRLAGGVTLDRATAEINAVASPWIQGPGREHVAQRVRPFTESIADPGMRYALWAGVFALVLLLCVAAANVANIVLARALSRRREIAVRSALGASRARLVMQVTVEAAVMSGLAAAIGVLGAQAAIDWVLYSANKLPFWVHLAVDWRAVAFATAVSLLASIVAGVGPAWRVTRGSMFDALRESSTTLRFGRVSGWLILAETAIAIALLSGTFVLTRSLTGFSIRDPRLPLDRVLVAQLYFGQPAVLIGANAPTDREVRRRVWDEFLTRVSAEQRRLVQALATEPGVRGVSVGSHFPGNEPQRAVFFIRDQQGGERRAASRVAFADASYLEVLNSAAVSGRFVSDADVNESQGVAVVNEPFVRQHFNGGNPIGHFIKLEGDLPMRGLARASGGWRQIVGVVPDLAVNPGNPQYADAVYLPAAPDTVIRVAVAVTDHPVSVVPALHRIAYTLEPKPHVQWTTTLEEQMQQPITALRAGGLVLGSLGAVALLLSCLGTYAIVAFSVAQRRREIAIRMAMGANQRNIVAAVIGPSALRLLGGTLAGGALGIGVQQVIGQMPFALAGAGAETTAVMVGLVSVAGALACAGPLRRALTLKPGDWLRE